MVSAELIISLRRVNDPGRDCMSSCGSIFSRASDYTAEFDFGSITFG